MDNIFEKIALDKKQSTESRRRPVTLLTPPLRTSIGIGIGLAATAVIWSIASTIPIYVQATGVMTPVSTVVTTKSLADGTIYYRFSSSAMDEPQWSTDAWRFYDNPKSFTNAQVYNLAQELRAVPKAGRLINKNSFYSSRVQRGTVIAQIFAPLERERLIDAINNLIKEEESTSTEIADVNKTVNVLRQQLTSRQSYLNRILILEKRGYATREVVLQEEDQVAGLRTEILRNEGQLSELRERLLTANNQLRIELADFINKTILFAENNLYLQEIIATPLTRVNTGDEILISSISSLTNPVEVPIFLAPRDATQVFPGMRVLATPSGLDRAQYGGIVGEVKWISKLPSSAPEVAARVGLPGVADLIAKRVGIPTEAVISLQRVKGSNGTSFSSGYRWSSKGEPPYRIKPGDVLEVEITTRKIRPIELVLPFLKKTLGLSPRYPKAQGQL